MAGRWHPDDDSEQLPQDRVDLNDEARGVLAEAAGLAWDLSSDKLRTCHLLLALTKASGEGGEVLREVGVTESEVRDAIQKLWPARTRAATPPDTSDGKPPPSRRVNRVIEEAMREAYVYGLPSADPTDLLLALTRVRKGGTSDAVFDELRHATEWVHGQVARRRLRRLSAERSSPTR
jgi:ATP-dependent Clp protease ATP-binding subunit ClpA